MDDITFEQAKRMSLWRWKNFPLSKPSLDDWDEFFRENEDIEENMNGHYVSDDCGFCHKYNLRDDCSDCPLQWEDAKVEHNSCYGENSYRCSRNFWHWAYWHSMCVYKDTDRNMRYWANKLYKEIEATVEPKGE